MYNLNLTERPHRSSFLKCRSGNVRWMILAVVLLFAFAFPALAQNQKITLPSQTLTVRKLFSTIEKQTGYLLMYSNVDLNTSSKVTFPNKQTTLKSLLEEFVKGRGIKYEITSKKYIILSTVPTNQQTKDNTNTTASFRATGRILDENKQPIIGATIRQTGTQNATVSDLNGYYALNAPRNSELTVTYLGYTMMRIKAGVDGVTVMEENTKLLNDVVVVGYGSMRKKDLTGAISVVEGKDVSMRSAQNLSVALQGTTAGVQVTRDSGDPDAVAKIRVRGITTISTTDPLVIIDGVPGNLDLVNSDDVESISVLKDAASASIYGARAASGVIVVTTKRGTTGKLSLNYNYEMGWEIPTTKPSYVNAQRYIEMVNETRYNDNPSGGWYQDFTEDQVNNWMANNLVDPDHYPNADWRSAILKGSAPRHSYAISMTAGTNVLKTNASFHFDKVDGLWVNKDYKRYMIRVNNDLQVNKYIAAHIDFNFKHSKTHDPVSNPLGGLKIPAIYAVKYSDGRWGDAKNGGNGVQVMHDGGFIQKEYNRLGGKASVDISPIPELKFSGVVAINYAFNKLKTFNKAIKFTYVDDPEDERFMPGHESTKLEESRPDQYDITCQLLANYDKHFGKHYVSAMAGYESYYLKTESLTAKRDYFEMQEFPYLDIGNADYQFNTGNSDHNAYRSFFGRIMYNYDNRYLAQFNIRRDGSSRFDRNHRWGNFPSVSLGWVLSEEKFMSKLQSTWLNYLKLRASWGQLGNERIGSSFPYQSLMGVNQALLYNGGIKTAYNTVAQWQYAVRDITWETTESFDIGLNLTLFQNRLWLNADYYKKKTKGMLLPLQIPHFIGYANPDVNAGKMNTTGFDLELGWRDHIGTFNYAVSANLSDYRSKMGDLKGTEFLGAQIKREGSEFNEWYGYLSDGIFQTQEEVAQSPKLDNNVSMGDIKYLDVSGPDGVPDGKISPEYDRVLLGGSLPRYLFGLNLSGDWHGFDFSVSFQGVGKQNVRTSPAMVQGLVTNWLTFPSLIDGNYWSVKNDEAQNAAALYPRLTWKGAGNNYAMSDYWLFNGRYIRLKNLTVGYTIPITKLFTRNLPIHSVRAYLSASDLFSLNKYPKGWDPEVSTSGYPITTTLLFGVSVNF